MNVLVGVVLAMLLGWRLTLVGLFVFWLCVILTFPLVSRLLEESQRLEQAERDEEEVFREKVNALHKAQLEMSESLGRLERLRDEKRMIFKKGDAVAAEQLVAVGAPSDSESLLALEVQANGGMDVVDWSTVFAGVHFGSPGAVLGDWNPGTPNFRPGES